MMILSLLHLDFPPIVLSCIPWHLHYAQSIWVFHSVLSSFVYSCHSPCDII